MRSSKPTGVMSTTRIQRLTQMVTGKSKTAVSITRIAYSVQEVADRLGCCADAVYREIRTGGLRCVRVAHRVLVPVSALDDYLKKIVCHKRCRRGRKGSVCAKGDPLGKGGVMRTTTMQDKDGCTMRMSKEDKEQQCEYIYQNELQKLHDAWEVVQRGKVWRMPDNPVRQEYERLLNDVSLKLEALQRLIREGEISLEQPAKPVKLA